MAKLTDSIACWYFWLVAALIWSVAIGWIRHYPNNTQAWYGKHLYVIGMIVLSSAITAMYYLWSTFSLVAAICLCIGVVRG